MADLDALDRLLVKPKRAKKHIHDLDIACDVFSKSNPYKIAVEVDPHSRNHTYRITSIQHVPLEIVAIAGDALQNLRSALDHLAYWLVRVAGNRPTTRTGFPIFESAQKYALRRAEKVQGMGQAAMETIDALRPYGGGDDTLWHLHQLNNSDKHRLLITVAAKNIGYNMTPSQRDDVCRNFLGVDPSTLPAKPGNFLTQPPKIAALATGDVLRVLHESEVDQNMQFLIDVAFAEPGIPTPEPVVDTLHRMANRVIGIICDFSKNGLF